MYFTITPKDPKESEREVYNQISPVLSEGQVILQYVKTIYLS